MKKNLDFFISLLISLVFEISRMMKVSLMFLNKLKKCLSLKLLIFLKIPAGNKQMETKSTNIQNVRLK